MKLVVLIVLAIVTTSQATPKIETLPPNSAVYIQALGNLKTIEQQTTIILFKDLNIISTNMDKIRDMITKLQILDSSIHGQYYRYIHSLTIQRIFKNIDYDFQSIKKFMPQSRIKRGWLNVVGNALIQPLD